MLTTRSILYATHDCCLVLHDYEGAAILGLVPREGEVMHIDGPARVRHELASQPPAIREALAHTGVVVTESSVGTVHVALVAEQAVLHVLCR